MKKFAVFLIALSILSALSYAAGAAEKPRITIYTSMYEDVIEAMT